MADISTLLGSIRERDSRSGILTADRYFREVQGCFDGGHCPINGADDPEQWAKQLAECEQKLTYTNSRTRVLKNSIQKSPEEGILVFDAIITTPHRDRDGDVLLTKGADLDMDMPLLWQHIAMQPIGKLVKVMSHTDEQLVGRFVIADTELGRDAAKLIRCGALRISHGFMPSEMEPMEDENGWLIKRFHIFETSVVSIPSNVQARITSISTKKFNTPVVQGWLKSFQKECKCKGHAKVADSQPVKPMVKERMPHPLVVQKDFDVERQHIEPAKLEYDWVSRFCSCEVKQLVNLSTFSPRIKMGSFLTGLRIALAESKEVDARRLTRDGHESPLEYETIQLNSKSSDHFMVDGISFRKHVSGVAFAVKFTRGWSGESVDIMCARKDVDSVDGILGDAWTWADANNFLKGEAFSLGGEFLPKSSETWDDVFLEKENIVEVKRTVDLLNAKGKSTPNRGQVLMGPPGTGKTLSARLMRNYANATFIWVGGKDAYYYGGIGAVMQAFEMAKELSPAIVVMEDIDASLDSRHAVDVLKTEMDGVARSAGIVTVLTTNHPESFPKALLDRPGRFHDVLKFDLPSKNVREQMLRKWLPDMPEASVLSAAESTKGYSGAHMYELCQYAKNIQTEDESAIADAVTKALAKIDGQRALIDESLMGDRHMAARRRVTSAEFDTKSPVAKVKRYQVGDDFVAKNPDSVESEFWSQLIIADTAVVRKSQQRISTLLASREREDSIREFNQALGICD